MTARGTSASRARSVASLCRPSGRSFVSVVTSCPYLKSITWYLVFNNGTTILSG